MDSDGLPIVGAGVDYTKVGPFHQKRTLTFLNHFLIRTTSFLNHFATICDEKLENLLIRIHRLEASMCILEAKLASIPGLEDVTTNNQSSSNEPSQQQTNIPETPVAQTQQQQQQEEVVATESQEAKPEVAEKATIKISQDSRYAKYFKMVTMGVPAAAVKQKMGSEGVDPDILDDPDVPAPLDAVTYSQEAGGNMSDESDFSD